MGKTLTSKVEQAKTMIDGMSRDEFAVFEVWYRDYFQDRWDQEMEEDAAAGKFDDLAARALKDHEAGRCKEL